MIKQLSGIKARELKVITWMMLSLLLVACSSQEQELTEMNRALSFQTTITKTRSAVSNINKEGEQITVFSQKTVEGNQVVPVMDNQKMAFENGGWSYAPLKYWDQQADYCFKAVYPFMATGVEWDQTHVTIADYSVFSQIDLLLSAPVYRSASDYRPVCFEFSHLLSNINFRVQKGAGWNDEHPLLLHKVVLKGMASNGTFSDKDREWEVSGLVEDATFSNEETIEVTHAAQKVLSNQLMIPQNMSSSIVLELSYSFGGNEYQKEIRLLEAGISTPWQMNQLLTYTLQISTNSITIGRPMIVAWGDKVFEDIDIEL